MFIRHFSTSHRGLTLSLLVFAAGISIWSSIGSVADQPGTHKLFASTAAQCLDEEDVLASLDRSRNGISLTCNRDKLTGSVQR